MKCIIGLSLFLFLTYSDCLEEKKTQNKEWTAKWINAPKNLIPEFLEKIPESDKNIFKTYNGLKPILYFRKTVQFEKVVKAKLYCAAKGAFKIYFSTFFPLLYQNSFQAWTPGWTDYNKTIQYYGYDVTYTMQHDKRVTIGMQVGPGWYSGYIGDKFNLYGDEVSALVELHLEFENGSLALITSDETWKVITGPYLYSDLVNGEVYYENLELIDWTSPNYNDSNWLPVLTHTIEKNIEFVEDTSPLQLDDTDFAKNYWKVGRNTYIYEFDRLTYGGLLLHVNEFPFTTRVQVRFGESLHPNGSLYTGKEGISFPAYTFVLNDVTHRDSHYSLIPLFPIYSFRYAEISGYPGGFYLGEVLAYKYTQNEIVGNISSNNKLVTNIFTYLKSSVLANMNSIPTTAPVGGGRVGWLEPAGLFSSSAFNLFNAKFFYTKWLNDIRNSQASSGAYSSSAPNVNGLGDASPGSGFAPILIAYNLYKFYEDIEAVEKNYIPNQKWLQYVISKSTNFLYTNNINEKYGDYANVNSETPREVLSTAYLAYSSLLMSKMAKILQRYADKDYYEVLHKNISNSFVKAYVNSVTGEINGDTQTGYVLSLVSQVLPEDLIPKAVEKLVNNIKAHEYHLTTGYIGTSFILPVLADYGHTDVAYKLLLQESYPSWGYMFKNANRSGLWERWNSWTEHDGFQGSSLNSVGLGTVGNFLFQYVAGINSDDEQISFKRVVIKPHIGEKINSFTGNILSNYGIITSSWNIQGNIFNIQITLPQNTTGKLVLPFARQTWIRELSSGKQEFQFSLNSTKI